MAGTRLHDQSMNVSIFRPAAWRQATSAPAEEPATLLGATPASISAASTPAWKGVPKKEDDMTSV